METKQPKKLVTVKIAFEPGTSAVVPIEDFSYIGLQKELVSFKQEDDEAAITATECVEFIEKGIVLRLKPRASKIIIKIGGIPLFRWLHRYMDIYDIYLMYDDGTQTHVYIPFEDLCTGEPIGEMNLWQTGSVERYGNLLVTIGIIKNPDPFCDDADERYDDPWIHWFEKNE